MKTLQKPTVTLTGHSLCATDWQTDDPQIIASAEAFRERNPNVSLEHWLHDSLVLAARVQQLGGATTDFGAVVASVQELRAKTVNGVKWLRTQLDETLEQTVGPDGRLSATIEHHLDQLNTAVYDLVGDCDGPLHRTLEKTMQSASAELVASTNRLLRDQRDSLRTLLAPEDPASPLAALAARQDRSSQHLHDSLKEMAARLEAIQTSIAEAKATAAQRRVSSAKGADHEDAVGVVLRELANAMGFDHEATGTTAGMAGSHAKVGDHVLGFQAAGRDLRLVVETTDSSRTQAAWRKQATRAMENRGAAAFLGIAKSAEQMPTDGYLAVLDSNALVVRFDPACDSNDVLVAALRLLRAVAAVSTDPETEEVDLAAIRRRIATCQAALQRFDALSRQAAIAKNATVKVSDLADELRAELTKQVSDLALSVG